MTPDYKKALTELLYQLADDNFIHAFRGSEWLGLAPHIEEDVAFSSINQDTMGHAVMYYKLLEELGEGKADDLAHLRSSDSFRNAVLLEFKNGTGEYLESPDYDWAFTVVRHLFYDLFKKIRLNALKRSSYEPLAQAARKILTEQTYHLMHWKTWFSQLMLSTEEARLRMEKALERCWQDMGGVLTLGQYGEDMTAFGLIASEDELKTEWMAEMMSLFSKVHYQKPERGPAIVSGNGRNGEHHSDLDHALNILSEVYRGDPQATGW
ncbi:MAG: 1,2-phenylacetyl-CoA epoxidase subunit PaaC [Tuberibacillus sp.]